MSAVRARLIRDVNDRVEATNIGYGEPHGTQWRFSFMCCSSIRRDFTAAVYFPSKWSTFKLLFSFFFLIYFDFVVKHNINAIGLDVQITLLLLYYDTMNVQISFNKETKGIDGIENGVNTIGAVSARKKCRTIYNDVIEIAD